MPGTRMVVLKTDSSNKWKDPVANFASLPTIGNNEGDIRYTLDTLTPYVWKDGVWSPAKSDERLKPPVTSYADLPLTDNTDGDMRVTLDDMKTYVWNNNQWNLISGSNKWKDPVISFSNLPLTGNEEGDVRYTLDDLTPYVWKNGTWTPAKQEGRLKSPVINYANLPLTGNEEGDMRVTLDDMKTYIWNNNQWNLTSGSSGGFSLTQLTKLGVVASLDVPYIETITISSTVDFNKPPIEVLKLTQPGDPDVVQTLCTFDNSDATSFQGVDSQVIFDGKMYLKTIYQENMIDGGVLGSGHLWSYPIDLSFKKIEKIEVI